MSVERSWSLVMLIAGGLAGLAASTIIQGGGPPPPLNPNTYGTYGFDGITVALLGRARPFGVLLAGLLFGALQAGGTVMQAATNPQVPVDIVEVIQGLIVLFVAAPPLIRTIFRLRAATHDRHGGHREGVERVTTLTAALRLPMTLSRRYLAAGFFILLGVIDIAVFGLFSHAGDATFQLSISGSGVQIPNITVPAAIVCYVVGAISVGPRHLARGRRARQAGPHG